MICSLSVYTSGCQAVYTDVCYVEEEGSVLPSGCLKMHRQQILLIILHHTSVFKYIINSLLNSLELIRNKQTNSPLKNQDPVHYPQAKWELHQRMSEHSEKKYELLSCKYLFTRHKHSISIDKTTSRSYTNTPDVSRFYNTKDNCQVQEEEENLIW